MKKQEIKFEELTDEQLENVCYKLFLDCLIKKLSKCIIDTTYKGEK